MSPSRSSRSHRSRSRSSPAGSGVIAQLRKLVLGETWTLPLGVAVTLLAGLALDAAGPGWWGRAGGFAVLAGAGATLAASLHRR